jgi:hypothetical protein
VELCAFITSDSDEGTGGVKWSDYGSQDEEALLDCEQDSSNNSKSHENEGASEEA